MAILTPGAIDTPSSISIPPDADNIAEWLINTSLPNLTLVPQVVEKFEV